MVLPPNQRRTIWLIHWWWCKKTGREWNNTASDDKQPYENKAAKLKKKYEKHIAAYTAKGLPDAAKRGVVKAEKRKKKKEEADEEEDEDDEEEEERDEDEENQSEEMEMDILNIIS